jgi:C1A family cysteine protease
MSTYAAELLGERRYGYKRSLPDARDAMAFASPLTDADVMDLPDVFSLRDEMPPVYDQGQLGSCTGNALAGAIQYFNMLAGTDFGVPSRLFIYYLERLREGTVTTDSGAYGRDGFAALRKVGVPPETVWPYIIARFADKPSEQAYADAGAHKIHHYTHARTTAAEVKKLVHQKQPVAFGFPVPESFEGEATMTTGVLPPYNTAEQFIGGHEMLIVGWKPGYMECRNSWGPNVMDNGYVWMPNAFLFGGYADDFRAIQS